MATAGAGRTTVSLDGAWDFVHHSDGVARQAVVPLPWQASFADLRQAYGHATYSRDVTIPVDGVTFLCFGAVSCFATVRLAGRDVAQHDNGWLPFDVQVPSDLNGQTVRVEVDCHLPGPDDASPDNFADIPHGKMSWYGPTGGLWQSVRMETRAQRHLTACAISADPATGQVSVTITQTGSGPRTLQVLDPAGQVVASGIDLAIRNPRLWSPEDPALYRLRVDLGGDVTEHSFGFRSFTSAKGQLFLNGKPFYMRAALDQDYYPEGICTPPSTAYLEDQFRKAKSLGLNMLRCHIKVPDPRYLEVADRLGMLLWYDLPNAGVLSEAAAKRLKQTMQGMIARDGNHPSIVIWTLINEDWGIRLCDDPAHRRWLEGMVDWLKQRDPSRLVCDNSPCQGNFHVKGDLDDFHYYRSVPERRDEWDALTAEFAQGAAWTWSPFGDGTRRGDEPKIVSEFGVWGLPQPAQVRLDGAEPWWMETGQLWGDGAAYPHGIERRFASLGLNRVFGSLENMVTQAQWYQFANLKYEIEVMRAWPQIQGYVITELTDVHWESNGLLDMNRNKRVFHDRLAQVNADVVIVPRVARYAGTAGQDWTMGLAVASGGAVLPPGILHWSDGTIAGQIAFPGARALTATDLGTLTLTLPQADANRMLTLSFALHCAGRVVARNQVDLALYAPRQTDGLPRIATRDAGLAGRARALGYAVVAADQADVTLTHALDDADIRAMQGGARYLILADGTVKTEGNLRVEKRGREQPFIPVVDDTPGIPVGAQFPLPNITLIARHNTLWRGDWIAGFSWIRREGVFADLPGGPLLDLSYSDVVPRHVMGGFSGWEFGGPVYAGVVVGWVHKPAAFIAERPVGRGALVASTFRLTGSAPGIDPVADALMDRLVKLAATRQTGA